MVDKTREAQDQITRAHQAKMLLENPLYIEAMQKIEIGLFGAFGDTKLEDKAERHELWQRMKIKQLFQAQFEHIVTTGEYASDTLKLIDNDEENSADPE